ncbi:DUF6222 family protein [Amycolatopsis sp. NPDC004772]
MRAGQGVRRGDHSIFVGEVLEATRGVADGRLGRGIVGSDLVAEMEREWARRGRENHDVRADRMAA